MVTTIGSVMRPQIFNYSFLWTKYGLEPKYLQNNEAEWEGPQSFWNRPTSLHYFRRFILRTNECCIKSWVFLIEIFFFYSFLILLRLPTHTSFSSTYFFVLKFTLFPPYTHPTAVHTQNSFYPTIGKPSISSLSIPRKRLEFSITFDSSQPNPLSSVSYCSVGIHALFITSKNMAVLRIKPMYIRIRNDLHRHTWCTGCLEK